MLLLNAHEYVHLTSLKPYRPHRRVRKGKGRIYFPLETLSSNLEFITIIHEQMLAVDSILTTASN